MKIALIGYGKMGHEIEKILVSRGHTLPMIIDQDNTDQLTAENLNQCDVAIEFTTPATAFDNIVTCLKAGIPTVCGTTAWLDRLPEATDLCQQTSGAFFYASNYSIGVNIFFAINRQLARMMNQFPEYDVTLNEVHHVQKKDAPSGTAVTLAEDILAGIDRKTSWHLGTTTDRDKLEVTAQRRAMVPGIHTIVWESDADTITIDHNAKNRSGFAMGAVLAAEYLADKRGTGKVYGMKDLLGF
ncbi:4-hydroxy-tetrahydrodipicolinate reductase [Millionella massiliensis]|uniref:4-hydroxy-tetrahydrodipicolinate reductase n=1 Tax=Millionella massiliensis TaxID=1871023 RepID=UPI0024B7019A|nr:4-hydroxy-tetrahydrodipicolinate reductase [Millionella massiliensis]